MHSLSLGNNKLGPRSIPQCRLAALFAVYFAYLVATTAVAEAKQSIDRVLSRLDDWLA